MLLFFFKKISCKIDVLHISHSPIFSFLKTFEFNECRILQLIFSALLVKLKPKRFNLALIEYLVK